MVPGEVFDLSQDGVGLLVSGRVEVGEQLSLVLSKLGGRWQGDLQIQLSATVLHVERNDDGRFRIGCRFSKPGLSPRVFEKLLVG